jgi:predicted Na+-dependent transporter
MLMSSLTTAAAAALAWLGRQGTRAIAAIVFIGIAVPPLGAVLKPYVTEAIFILLCIAFLRVDLGALRGYVQTPTPVLKATLWTMLVVPLMIGVGSVLIGLDVSAPELYLGLMLYAVAPPMMAAPAFAAVLGLDATLVLVVLVAGSLLTPVTAPAFAYWFVGSALSLSPLALGFRLFAILAGSVLVAVFLRRIIGADTIERRKQEIDGINILVALVFVAAVMESVASRLLATPMLVIALTALAFALTFATFALTMLMFAGTDRERTLALAFTVSQRNMGLMLAATGGALPDLVWLYFGLSQFPIYLTPQLFKLLVRREKSAGA